MMEDNIKVSPSTTGYLTDDHGKPSTMRMMSFLALIVASFLAIASVFGLGSESGSEKTELVLYFLVAAFAPKATHKFIERSHPLK